MRWALRTLWACSVGFHAFPTLLTTTARQLWQYLLTIVCLSALILSLPVCVALRREMRALIAWAQQLPTITIVNGTATLAESAPIHLERREIAGVGNLSLVVDVEAQAPAVQPATSGFHVQLSAHELVVQQGRARRAYEFRRIRHLTVDDAFIARWGWRLTHWVCVAVPFALVLYGLCARTLQAALWSSVTWASLRLVAQPMPFPQLWRLALFALGPPLMFAATVEALLLGRTHPILWLIYVVVYAVMFAGALNATRRSLLPPPE